MSQDIKILPLTLNNYPQCKFLVTKAATIADAEQYLEENAQIPNEATQTQMRAHMKAEARASIIIQQSISRDAQTLLGANYQDSTPHELMQKIQTEIATATTSDKRELQQKAEDLKYDDRMSISERALKHMELRSKMIAAGCEDMDEEKKTVQRILDGIEQHPDYAPHIAPLTIRPPEAIKEAKDALLKEDIPSASEQTNFSLRPRRRISPNASWLQRWNTQSERQTGAMPLSPAQSNAKTTTPSIPTHPPPPRARWCVAQAPWNTLPRR